MAFDFKQALSGIAEGVKKAYYFFEDKYYSLLDSVDEKIPVYRFIDPIDNFVPTFFLFIAAFIALFVGLFFLLGQQGIFAANVQVLDADGLPIANQQVSISFDGNTADYLTDDNGSFLVNLKQKEQIATILIEAEGFERFEEEITLVAGANEFNKISLKKAGPIMFTGPYNITVVDSSGQRITDTDVTVRFTCSMSVDAVPDPITNSKGFFTVSSAKACGDLFASFVAAGYEPKNNVRISRESEEVELAKLDSRDSKGKINVIVKDASNNAVAGALVALFDSEGVKLLEDSSDASGMLVFEEVLPGTYELSASTDDGRQAKKTVSVEAGVESTVTILLPNANDKGKKIILNVVDSNTSEPLNGVTATVYADNSFFKTVISDVRGIITINVADANEPKSYSAVLSHPSYVLKIVNGLIVSTGSVKDAQTITLEKLASDGSNYGSLKIFVVNEQNAPVPSALVSLFLQGFDNPLFENPKIADENGMVFLSNLPPGSFKAYALKENFDEEFSENVQVTGGSSAIVFVRLVIGKGAFKAHVADLQGAPIQGATVEFFELVTNMLLDSGKTSASGYYLSKSFKANKNIYLHVTATGFLPQTIFLPQTTNPVSVVKDINRDVNVTMYRVIEIDSSKKISFKFAGLFKEDNRTPVAILQPNQVYLAKFNMVLPSDATYSNIVMHTRVGLDSQTSADLSDAVLRNVSAPLLPDIVLSKDFNPANPFSNQNPVQSDLNAKQANVSWQKLEKGVFEIVAKVFVKPGLAANTAVELHAKAKAITEGTAFESDDFVEVYRIGQNVCKKNCLSFDWLFEIESDSGRTVLDVSKKFSLDVESDYNLFYTVYNLSETEFSSSSLSATIAGNGILSFKDSASQTLQVFSNAAIPANSAIVLGMQSPIRLHSNIEAAFADLNLSLSTTPAIASTDKSNNVQLQFSVLAGNNLLVELPQSIPQNPPSLTIKVKDNATKSLLADYSKVHVWVLPDSDLSSSSTGAVEATKVEGSDGTYSVSFGQAFMPKEFVSVKVTAPNYRTFFGTVPVTGEFVDYPSNFDYSCLKIYADQNPLSDTKSIERPATSTTINVLVTATNCPYASVVSVAVPYYLASSISVGGEKPLQTTASTTFQITVNSTVPQGKIPLYLAAKFSEDSFKRRLKGAYLIVTDSKSCFAMIASQSSLKDVSQIVETSQGDFEAGTLDKIDTASVPGTLQIALEEGSQIASLGNGWFAVPGTDKVLVFQYNNPVTKVFNAPGVKPSSNIASAGGYFGVVSPDTVWASKYSDNTMAVQQQASGVKTNSKIAALLFGTDVFFATVADGGRAYVRQANATKLDILALDGVDSTAPISSASTYFSVVGNNKAYSWDYRHITSSTTYPLCSYPTPGTKTTSKLAVSNANFATVSDSNNIMIWNAAAASPSIVSKNLSGVSAASNIIPNTGGGYFFVAGTDKFFSVPESGASPNEYSAPGVRPESNIVSGQGSAVNDFVVAGIDRTYHGNPAVQTFFPLVTVGAVPSSSAKINQANECLAYDRKGRCIIWANNYFSVVGNAKIFVGQLGYGMDHLKEYSVNGISPLAPINTRVIAGDVAATDSYFFIVASDHSFIWSNSSMPIDLATQGTASFSSVGFDATTKNFVVAGKDNVFVISESAFSDSTNYPPKSIALPGTSYRSKIASYNGGFIITGIGKLYAANYDFSKKALSKIEFANASSIDVSRYAPLATYNTQNYYSFGIMPNATIVSISWNSNEPPQTSVSAQYSLDSGANWSNAKNGDYVYRAADQIKLKLLLSTTSEIATPSIQDIAIKYAPQAGAGTTGKFDFNISHRTDAAMVQNKCYGFVSDLQLPALNAIAGIEPSSIILRYDPMPKPLPPKLKELFKFPQACVESSAGSIVECATYSSTATDTFVSEAKIPDCNQHSDAADYTSMQFGNSLQLLDAKQRIVLSQNIGSAEQDCYNFVPGNYLLFKLNQSFLSSLPGDQKSVRLHFYSNNDSIASHKVFEPVSPWSEATTWNTKPSLPSRQIGNLSYVGNNAWELDINGLYKKWKENPETNNGLYIVSDDILRESIVSEGNSPKIAKDAFPSVSFNSFSFYSSNYSDASKRPTIVFGQATEQDKDTMGALDFNVSNNSLVGEDNFALLDYQDYAWLNGKLVNAAEKFHVQLRASQQQNCAMPNNVFGKTGAGALPNILFSWQWKNIDLNSDSGFGICDEGTQNYVYCDSAQFSIELLKKLEQIRQLALQGGKQDEIAKLLHFNAYLLKDGYGTDFRKDFDYYYLHVSPYNADSTYGNWWHGYFNDSPAESRLQFVSGEFSTEKVLGKPGLYKIDLGFNFEGGQFVFFLGSNPSAKTTITMTFLKEPATPNPLYELPFDGEIGFSSRPDETAASRNNYGLAYSGEQSVYIANTPGEEIIKTNNVPSSNPANTLAVSKDANIQALNASELRGGLLLVSLSGKSLKFLKTNATPVAMEISSIDANARGYYKIEQLTNPATNETKPITFSDYGNVWTGIYSPDCKDFAGNNLFYNVPDRNAFSLAESCADRSYSRGFKWVAVATGKTIILRTIFFSADQNTYFLKPACSGQTKFVSPNDIASSSQQGSAIALDFSKQKLPTATDSVADIFGLVKEEKACVSSPAPGELFFWWNPQFLERELLPAANNTYSVMSLLSYGAQLCPEQGTESQ